MARAINELRVASATYVRLEELENAARLEYRALELSGRVPASATDAFKGERNTVRLNAISIYHEHLGKLTSGRFLARRAVNTGMPSLCGPWKRQHWKRPSGSYALTRKVEERCCKTSCLASGWWRKR
jgi:hypothetical protein